MNSRSEQLKERTMQFAVDVLRLIDSLPRSISSEVIARQLAKSATSVTANYRATCNARSRAEFIARLGVVVEEADESVCWLELAMRASLLTADASPLKNEAVELRAIFAKSLGTARANARQITK
jgi:four helix bundle protein